MASTPAATNSTVTINSNGDVSSDGGAIGANTNAGAISVTSVGNLNGNSSGINLTTASGAITVDSTGDVMSSAGRGINLYSVNGSNPLMVTSVGDVSGASGGISAQVAYGNGSVTIDSSGGTVTSSGGRGISAANNGSGAVSVTATGDVQGATYGIYAHSSTGTIDVMSAGVTATAGTAIHAMNSVGGGNVTVAATGDIDATGGSGILAVSTAGAVSITATNVASTGYAAVYGRTIAAQPVTIDVTGDIQGSNVGVFAQATTGAIMIDVGGDINAAYGVTSYGGSSNTVTLNGGTSYGSGRGVQFLNGGTNTLNNNSELSGGDFAVYGTGGNETINNYKTITGNVNLGAGTNAFNNNATFRPGTTVNLGAGNTLTNAGFLSPGGENAVQTTALTGNLVQTSAGAFIVDIDEGGAGADRVTASGTANLAGLVAVNVINLTSASGSVVIASAAALASTATIFTNSGIAFSLEVQGNQLVLSWGGRSILGKLSNLNANQRAVAAYLDALADAGPSAALQVLIDALRDLGETDLLAALNRLLPEVFADAQIAALHASLGFSNSLLSCKVNGTDTASIIHEGQCLWAGASAQFLDQGTTFSQLGFNETTGLFAAGAQVAIAPDWRLGIGAGYQSSTIDTPTGATSDGQMAQGGVALKYNPGPFLLAGVFSGGRAWYGTTRPVGFTGLAGTAHSDSHINIWNGGVRAAYVFGSQQLYFKPMADAAATRLDLGGFSESGGGAANLTVARSKQTVYTIAPALEIGTEWWLANGTLVRPFVRGGATWYEGGNLALSASFLGAPGGLTPFTIETKMDDVMGTVGAGLDVITDTDTVLHLTYDGQIGTDTQIHSVGLKASARF